MRWATAMVLLAGCVTSRATWRERVESLEREAPACSSFGGFDASARAASEAAAKQAPATELLASQRAVRTARLACARHALEMLATSRDPRAELDAMAAGFDEDAFDRLIRESLGAVDGSLSAMIAEAKEAAREGWRLQRDARAQEMLETSSTAHERTVSADQATMSRGATSHDLQFAQDHHRLASESAAHDRQAASAAVAPTPCADRSAEDGARAATENAPPDRPLAQSRDAAANDQQLPGKRKRSAPESAAPTPRASLARDAAGKIQPVTGSLDRGAPETPAGDRWTANASMASTPCARSSAADEARLASESAAHDRQFRKDAAQLDSVGENTGSRPTPTGAAPDERRRDQVWLATESAAHDRQFRKDAAKLGSLGGGDSGTARPLGEETEPLRGGARKPTPVEAAPGERWSRVQPALTKARSERKTDAVAALLEPFRDDPAHRDEAAAALEAASRQHLALAQEAGPRTHAAALHRALAARFSAAAPAPAQGSFILERWLCPSPKPTLPSLAAGIELLLRVRCQSSQPRSAPPSEKESLFENERALVKTTTDGVASVTCAGQSFQRVLHREALSLDDPALEQRRLEDDLKNLAREVRAQCETTTREQSAADCAGLATLAPLDAEERFAAHASPSGPWPACFTAWFRERYGIEP